MKKIRVITIAVLLCLGCFFCLSGCARRNGGEAAATAERLAYPSGLSVAAEGRLITVSWDAVENAIGYVINTASAGCSSGNRIINTAEKTVTNRAGAAAGCDTAEDGITDRGNGFVTFTGETSFTIWMMAAPGSGAEIMADSLSAQIMSVGDGVSFTDSELSEVYLWQKN